MKIIVKTVKENKDGSADAMVTMDREGLTFLCNVGLFEVMREALGLKKGKNDGVRDILAALPKEGGKVNSKKIVAKIVARTPSKSITGNRAAPKVLGKKRN